MVGAVINFTFEMTVTHHFYILPISVGFAIIRKLSGFVFIVFIMLLLCLLCLLKNAILLSKGTTRTAYLHASCHWDPAGTLFTAMPRMHFYIT